MSSVMFIMFLISGFCSLLYQITWIRLAFAAFGIITPILSVVLSVFMLGLALGSWYGGEAIARMIQKGRVPAILFYAIAQFFIGVGGLVVPFLFENGQSALLSFGSSNSFQYLLFSAFILSLSILPWCLCMGATTPFMLAFAKQIKSGSDQNFSYLYLANSLGAMLGSVVTALIFIELFGFQKTLILAVFLNFLLVIVSVIVGVHFFHKKDLLLGVDAESVQYKNYQAMPGKNFFLVFLWLTGFTSMGSEVVWTRIFTPVLQTAVYSFAAILAAYLLATVVGSYFYRSHIRQGRVVDNAILMIGLAFSVFLTVLFGDPRVWWHFDQNWYLLVFLILLSVTPFCGILGYLTPKIIDECSCGDPRVAGRVYTINIIGCILGPLCTGYVFLPLVGLHLSQLLLFAPLVVCVLFYLINNGHAKQWPVRLTSMVVVLIFIVSSVFLSSYEEYALKQGGLVKRDYAATVIANGAGLHRRLLVNGVGMTRLTTITKCMAHFPLSIRQKVSQRILVLCLGMGTTFRSGVSWGIETIGVELIPSVKDFFWFYFDDAKEILANPKAHVVIDDARRFLKRTKNVFDVITIDPPPPTHTSGSSFLYSKEFYRILKTRLSSSGIVAQWLPEEGMLLQAVVKSLRSEFPYVRVFISIEGWGYHLLASQEPFTMPHVEQFLSRLPSSAEADLMEWINLDRRTMGLSAGQLYERFVSQEIPLGNILTSNVDFLITDDRPINEYFFLRKIFNREKPF